MTDRDLKPQCPLCKGAGKVEATSFVNPGGEMVSVSCYACRGRGWLYRSAEELTERVIELERDNRAKSERVIELERALREIMDMPRHPACKRESEAENEE